MELSEIYIYPVKSLAGIKLETCQVAERGFKWDRHWMLVDEKGNFVTQREIPAMALIRTRLESRGLLLSAKGQPDLFVSFESSDAALVDVRVWSDNLPATQVGREADDWLSRVLEKPVHLVAMADSQQRRLDPDYANDNDQTGFADGFPFLLIGQSSLDDLNSRLEQSLEMRRFRPNLVVSGAEAFAEDTWKQIRIGQMVFRVVKPCSRCAITTVNPDTAERGAEPLKTLAAYRRRGNKVYFGQNLVHDGLGSLSVGDKVEIIQ